MKKFDDALVKLGKTFFYTGNPPSNENEYNAMKHNINNAPTWLEIQIAIDNLPNKEDKKASGKQKLKDLD
jgi:hypothetical protein